MRSSFRAHMNDPVWPCLLVVILLAGCASTRPPASSSGPDAPLPAEDRAVARKLRRAVEPWLGTPYRLGGTTTAGVDCSAFVAAIYTDVFSHRLPRTTGAQARRGEPIARSRLSAGDLVFFDPPESKSHVGIYLSNRRFAHASSSRGVAISSLSQPYWTRSFRTARRIVPAPSSNAPEADRSADAAAPESKHAQPQDAGW